MNTKLATITTQYSKFSDNQVLTKAQLNEFLDYFQDQDHLSRIGLSGVGIVCGFKVTYNALINTIDISQGYGVTTDGDLLTLVEPKGSVVNPGLQLLENAFRRYTHYKPFIDDKAKYTPFFYDGDDQITLLELFPSTPEVLNDDSYTFISEFTPEEIQDKVVLLYLENYAKEGDLCTALNCDNQGIEQVARLRVLLVSVSDAIALSVHDSIYNKHDWFDLYNNLPEVAVKRDIINSEHTETYNILKDHYHDLIKESETLTDLRQGLDAILTRFGRDTISTNISALFAFTSASITRDFQYRYDVLKDLVDTYNEIKELLLHINVQCCPDIGSFPKHIMLGKLIENKPYHTLRHRFYKSPVIGHEDDNLKRVYHLLTKVDRLAHNFNRGTKSTEIKIIPSKEQSILGHKAIPFYYHVTQNLLRHWNYDKTKNFAQDTNLSYHTELLAPIPSVQEPLCYSLDHYNFLNIQGIQGRPYRDALEQVLELRKTWGLNFDVKVLSINASTQNIDIDDYRCEFEDLNVLLQAWTQEQECILAAIASFFSGFSTQEAGRNIKEIEYTQVVTPIEIDSEATSTAVRAFADAARREDIVLNEQRSARAHSTVDATYYYGDHQGNIPLKKNVIEEYITVDETTVGYHMKQAIADNKQGSLNDIKNAAKEYVRPYVITEVWEGKEEIRDLFIYDSIDLMAATYVLTEKIPNRIRNIDSDTIDLYEITLGEVCTLVKRLKVVYQQIDLGEDEEEDTLKHIVGLLINQLSFVCCSGKKLAVLLEEIEKRKETILNQIQLSQFVKKHPGLRHRAGVPMGGTFIMAYLNENSSDQPTYEPVTMVLDFHNQPIGLDTFPTDEFPLPNEIPTAEIDTARLGRISKTAFQSSGQLQLWDDRLSTPFIFLNQFDKDVPHRPSEIVLIGRTLERTVSNFANFLNNIWQRAGAERYCSADAKGTQLLITLRDQSIRSQENYILFSNSEIVGTNDEIYFDENGIIEGNITSRNTVVADFALPYLCCSDCSPVNFVIPKEPVELNLPVDTICLDDSIALEPIPFDVSPEDGEVKAVVPEALEGFVIQDDDGNYLLDTTLVDPSLYGTPIAFTVNDEATAAVVTVYGDVNLVVSVTGDDAITYNTDHSQAIVKYTVSGAPLDGLSFAWDLGNGETSTETPNTDGEFTHPYILPVNEENTITPSLSVSNGPCPHLIAIDSITFEDPITALELEDTQFCVDPNTDEFLAISYSTTPSGATVTVKGDIEGISITDGHIEVNLNTFTAFDTPIQFAVNGEVKDEPTLTIINQATFADFSFDLEETEVDEGTESVTVQFTIEGLTDEQKEELGFNWVFGDGGFSSEIDASNTYDVEHKYEILDFEPGRHIFEVMLQIEGGPCNFVTITKEIVITINEVDITFILDEREICIDLETGISTVGYTLNPVVSLEVQDDTPGVTVGSTSIEINHELFTAFNTPIQFIVDGELNTAQTLVVRSRPVKADFNWSPEVLEVDQGTPSIEVDFNIDNLTDEQTERLEVLWDFGDGNESQNFNTSHIFDIPETAEESITFTIALRLEDGPCEPVIITRDLVIIINPVDITFRLDTNEICIGRATGNINVGYTLEPLVSLEVQGDIEGIIVGTSTIEINPTQFTAFNTPLQFVVDGEPNSAQTLTVRERPFNTNFNWSPEVLEIEEGAGSVTVDFSLENVSEEQLEHIDVSWNFGDDNTSGEKNPSHEYTIPEGTTGSIHFDVTATLNNDPCPPVIITRQVSITINPLDVNFIIPSEICQDSQARVTSVPYELTPVVSLEIDGDVEGLLIGTNALGISRELFDTFNTPIRFIVNGEVHPTQTLTVRQRPVNANFNWTPKILEIEEGTGSITVDFNLENISDEQLEHLDVHWDFGDDDNNTSEENNPSHSFIIPEGTTAGTIDFDVTLTVQSLPCDPVVITRQVSVTITPLDISFSLSSNELCLDSRGSVVTINYDLSPDVPITIAGSNTGMSLNTENKTLQIDPEFFTRYNNMIRFRINGDLNNSETLIVRRHLHQSDLNFSWSPLNPTVSPGQTSVTIDFNGPNLSTTDLLNVDLSWSFSDEQTDEGSSPSLSFDIDSFPITATVTAHNPPCGTVTHSNTITIEDPVDIPTDDDCVNLRLNDINEDFNGLPKSDNIPSHHNNLIKTIINPTIALYDDVILAALSYLNGNENDALRESFEGLMNTTFNTLLENQGDEVAQPLEAYYKAQVRLLFNILHCQDEQVLVESKTDLQNMVTDLVNMLNSLREATNFDQEKELETYLQNCLNDPNISNELKGHIQRIRDEVYNE